jgi:hypothetical protein
VVRRTGRGDKRDPIILRLRSQLCNGMTQWGTGVPVHFAKLLTYFNKHPEAKVLLSKYKKNQTVPPKYLAFVELGLHNYANANK